MSRHDQLSSFPELNVDRILAISIRIIVWLTFFGILYLLKSFSLLIFLTFVFAYIQSSAVNRLKRVVASRTIRVFIVGIALLGILSALGSYLLPQVRQEFYAFVEKLPSYFEATDLELRRFSRDYPTLGQLLPDIDEPPLSGDTAQSADAKQDFSRSPTGILMHRLLNVGSGEQGASNLYHTLDTVRNLGAYLAGIGSSFFLSLLFSFLIVLDLPSLTASARSLKNTKISFIYDEVAPSIGNFARVMGKALEAQLFIALLNTFLTGIGLLILGLASKLAFLSLIVFCCSFVPVAGVIISSIPICLVALQEGGLMLAVGAVVTIIVAHMIETYILNPRIYGHHMRMNPVVVLIILTIGGKMFHVWGLILGVPVCTYIFGHAIQYQRERSDLTVCVEAE